jgi:hypothetical protein
MLAGGMVIAAPSMVPEAAAAGQLYVSAETHNSETSLEVVKLLRLL